MAAAFAAALVAAPALAMAPSSVVHPDPERAAARLPGQPTAAPPAAPIAISLETPGTNERVSVDDADGQLVGLHSDQAAVTPDGRLVVFHAGLSAVGIAGQSDRILLRDRAAGTTTQIYPPEGQAPGLAAPTRAVLAEEPTISADGSLIAFTIRSVQGAEPRLVLWRRGAGLSLPLLDKNLRSEVAEPSFFTRGGSLHPRLSADGSVLVFQATPATDSDADLVAGYYALVFSTQNIEALSAATGQTTPFRGPAEFGTAAVSADGNLVAFSSSQDFQFVPIFTGINDSYPGVVGMFFARPEGGDVFVPRPRQIWLRNRLTKTTTLVSSTPAVPGAAGDVPGSRDSDHPAMSADGRVIAFDSMADDLVRGDGNGTTDVFARAEGATLRRVSVRPDGGQADDSSTWPAVSTDGLLIAFASRATNLVPGDTNHRPFERADRATPFDIFLNGPAPDRLARVSVGIADTEADDSSLRPSLAANGDLVVFDSVASNLIRGDTNQASDVFVRIRSRPKPTAPAISANPNPVQFGAVVPGKLDGFLKTVIVTNPGTAPLSIGTLAKTGPDEADFLLAVDTCSGRTLSPGAGCSVGLLLVVATSAARTATVLVPNNSKQDPYLVPLLARRGERPRLDVLPRSGPPGTVAIARGTGFPPQTPIAFAWSKGITPIPLALTVTDAEGAFTAQVLVLPRDIVGSRDLRAIVDLPGFGTTKAPFLVTRPTGNPPLFTPTRGYEDRTGRVIVLRR